MIDTALSRRERQRIETRTELVAAAHAIVTEEGYDGLTIRKLAERVGLATMSVYSYFADKQAILTAVAEDTFEILARRIESKLPPDPVEGLRIGLREYVVFGLDNPNEYRTIFMTPQVHQHEEETYEQLETQNPAFQGLLRSVNAAIDAGRMRGDPRAISVLLWTAAHGAVSILLTFPKFRLGDPLDYAGRMIDMAVDSLASHEVRPFEGQQDC